MNRYMNKYSRCDFVYVDPQYIRQCLQQFNIQQQALDNILYIHYVYHDKYSGFIELDNGACVEIAIDDESSILDKVINLDHVMYQSYTAFGKEDDTIEQCCNESKGYIKNGKLYDLMSNKIVTYTIPGFITVYRYKDSDNTQIINDIYDILGE